VITLRKKDLERELENTPKFSNPLEVLEQYITPSNIAADILWLAYMAKDLNGELVLDLGCGTGRLSYGAALLGAGYVICIDIDYDALSKAKDFLEIRTDAPIDFIAGDIRKSAPVREVRECTVVMNPPFGVHLRGADTDFVKAALSICRNVYSLHKMSKGLVNVLSRIAHKFESRLEIIKSYKFPIRWFLPKHKKKVRYVETVLVRFKQQPEETSQIKG